MKNFYLGLLIFCVKFYASLQNQDLCAEAKAKGFTFANDPSACDRYLYCKDGEDGTFEQVIQLSCAADYPDSPNFFEDSCYSNDPANNGVICYPTIGSDLRTDLTATPEDPNFNENYVINLCPGSPNLQNTSLMFADPTDTTCQKYYFCREDIAARTTDTPPVASSLGTVSTCTGTLLFDRNSGKCSLPEKAPCADFSNNAPADPCVGTTGYLYKAISCTKYAICLDGVKVGENDCAPDLVFNTDINQCDRPENFVCPTIMSLNDLKGIPRAQRKSWNGNPLIEKLRTRIFMGRHLRF